MKLYSRLAWTGIRNNRKLYIPYLLSCIGTVMMYYIMHSLSVSPILQNMRGGSNLTVILTLGKFVIAVFSLLFLFYTNSFLIRRRYKEFGLYNVLGMDKHGISRVVLWETVVTSLIGLGAGLLFGIALSKLAELGLLRTIDASADFHFHLAGEAFVGTLEIYGLIFVLLLVKSLWQVRRAKPLELLRSENYGEKPPKANWIVAILGLLVLGAAYYISVTITSPLNALTIFFVAVLMVIAATYLLFMAGSVTICRLLQKNPRYYYRKDHFVSVSSMTYRMKRNGAGLASICILSTMVLVMISSSASLYFGMDDALASRFPQKNVIDLELPGVECTAQEQYAQIRKVYEDAFDEFGVQPKNVTEFPLVDYIAMYENGKVSYDPYLNTYTTVSDKLRVFYFVGAEDFERLTGQTVQLAPGEAVACSKAWVPSDPDIIFDGLTIHITDTVDVFPVGADAVLSASQNCMLVISDLSQLQPLEAQLPDLEERNNYYLTYYYGYDVDADDDTVIELYNTQTGNLNQVPILSENGYGYTGGCFASEKYDFLSTYGGLFFIGVCLSAAFMFAAALIIYYKQLSEGYEDQSRFAIMQKVGMTKKDIRKSINSQILTVFFAPLVMAGVHLGFALPLVWKILQLFGLTNLNFMLLVTGIAFVVFGIFYAIIYKLTARAYYSIVSKQE